jgi:hypothetical protein
MTERKARTTKNEGDFGTGQYVCGGIAKRLDLPGGIPWTLRQRVSLEL